MIAATDLRVATTYRFATIENPSILREQLLTCCEAGQLLGTILLGCEGINLTVAGPRSGLDALQALLQAQPGFETLVLHLSDPGDGTPFRRLKVRVRDEIVALGQGAVDVSARAGTGVPADRWDEVLDHPSIPVIDVRNDFEVAAGRFRGALDPGTRSFREFPDWVREHLDPQRHPRVAMYCTGGIRCEKASAWMREQGFAEVLQLQGGILAYLEAVGDEASQFDGECFVFDDRVALRSGLAQGDLQICHGCRRPLDAEDVASPLYEDGVCCAACATELDERQRAGRRERARQVQLAAARGDDHLAPQHPPARRRRVP